MYGEKGETIRKPVLEGTKYSCLSWSLWNLLILLENKNWPVAFLKYLMQIS